MGEEYLLEEVKSSAGESLAASGDIFQKDIMEERKSFFSFASCYGIIKMPEGRFC